MSERVLLTQNLLDPISGKILYEEGTIFRVISDLGNKIGAILVETLDEEGAFVLAYGRYLNMQ